MSVSNEEVLKVMQKRAGINGRSIDAEIKAAMEKLAQPIIYNGNCDGKISYVFNPEG